VAELDKNPWASESKKQKQKYAKTLKINQLICLLFSSWFCRSNHNKGEVSFASAEVSPFSNQDEMKSSLSGLNHRC
jgi:hypothetical protein